MIEELSERQDSKIEQFKETGSYKEVARVLGSLDTPRKGSSLAGTPHPKQGSAIKPNPNYSAKRTSGGDKNGNSKTKPSPEAKHEAKKTSQVPEKPKIASPPATRPVTTRPAPVAAPSQEPAQKPDIPAGQAAKLDPRPNRPVQPSTPRVHLNPVPQSPYRHHRVQAQPPPEQEESKGWMDYFLDILIGTSTTVPKICNYCGAHNGLVPVEEQHNVQFVCYMCKAFNNGIAKQASSSSQSAQDPKSAIASALKSRLGDNRDNGSDSANSEPPTEDEAEPKASSSSAKFSSPESDSNQDQNS